MESIANLQVNTQTSGTFVDLCRATKNRERWQFITTNPAAVLALRSTANGAEDVPAGTVIGLKGALARLPDAATQQLYYESLSEAPEGWAAFVGVWNTDLFWLDICSAIGIAIDIGAVGDTLAPAGSNLGPEGAKMEHGYMDAAGVKWLSDQGLFTGRRESGLHVPLVYEPDTWLPHVPGTFRNGSGRQRS